MSEVSQPPTSDELPPGHQGEPAAAASSDVGITASDKVSEATVPIYKEEEEPAPLSYRDDVNVDSEKAAQLEEVKGDRASEETLAAEQGNTFEAQLEEEEEEEGDYSEF